MKTASQHTFAQVPSATIPRSSFDRTHSLKTTFDAGYLIPIFVDEALPGDTFNLNATLFGRLATPIHPLMDNMYLDTHFFAVPIRLLWNNFQKFMGEQDNPADSTDYLVPQITHTPQPNSIYDYMGLPTLTTVPIKFNALHFRAYNLIFNEWYRDQNLQQSVVVNKSDIGENPSTYELKRRGKRHDYFTSCLPWPQKGPAVSIPLGTEAPIRGNGGMTYVSNQNDPTLRNMYGNQADGAIKTSVNPNASGNLYFSTNYNQVGLEADLSLAAAATINELREAFQIQKLYERDARGGTRYTEIIRSHFGVTSPDARLQRPEFLGGNSQRINITPVAQTQETTATSPQANLAGYGTVGSTHNGFTKSFTEHCVIIGLASIRSDLNYQQGMNRMWSRQTRFDYYWPALAHIGEQAVLNKEIYAGEATDEDVFGYQERYGEYRYKPSMITGAFRSNAVAPLDSWHLAQDFVSLPSLNSSFIEENPPVDRVIAFQDEPHLILDGYFQMRCARPMPLYGVPGNIDRF